MPPRYTLGCTTLVQYFHLMQRAVTRVYVPRLFVLSQQRFGVTDIKAPLASQLSGLERTVLQLLEKSVLQLSVTALLYLEDSRKIHLQGVRARRSKDTRRSAPQCAGEREREHARTQERKIEEKCFGSSFYMFFPPPGPAL